MNLSRKFIITLTLSVLLIAIANIIAFYVFYSSYIRLYLSEKIQQREDVTIEYINSIIEKQALDDISDFFSDVEIEFFELLDVSDGKIPLSKEENVNIVVDFLAKSGVSPKYIEEIIPENNLEKILEDLKNTDSPESNFVRRLIMSLVVFNIILLAIFSAFVFFFIRHTIRPIERATNQIRSLQLGKYSEKIEYHWKDEIGLLIQSINKLNKRLSVQEGIRSRLLADISHELKTPITSIQCYLEGISDGVIKLSDSTLKSITSEMSRLISLVNKIMEYEKFENSEVHPQKEVLNPYTFISHIRTTLKQKLAENDQSITLSGSRNMEIFADKDLFSQLVYNLVWNFQKYAGHGTKLRVTIEANSLVFSDNGQGISRKELPYLFDKFYQGKKEKSWDIAQRGIGVGLSVVQKIIYSHGWRCELDSDTWKGFSFTIYFDFT
jgi:signal transduction histidine kinase